MRALLALYEQGQIEPKLVRLGALPDDASPAMRGIADDIALRMGLRLAVDDERPLPYATSEAVRAGLCIHRMQASRAIGKLVLAGVIENAGCLPRRPGGPPNGTKLYAPPQGPRQ